MTLYLDTSVIVPLFVTDTLNERAETLIGRIKPAVAIGDFGMAEFASAIANRVRRGDLSNLLAQIVYSQFDAWTLTKSRRIELVQMDLSMATNFMRRLDLPLRTGDAIQVAVAQRIGATLATFDRQMAESAGVLGVPVITR